jgi:uncharacterized protein
MDDTIELDPRDRDEFLGTGGTGVLAFSSDGDEPPHSIPVSYGYDANESVFYFRLATGPDSEKGDLPGRAVSFVAYGKDDGWRSVVARGRLEDVTEEAIATETLNGLDHVDIPLLDVFDRPTRTVSFEFFRLLPEETTGRKESRIRD